VNVIKALLLIFLTQNGGTHVSVKNVSFGQPQELHEKRCPSPQKKLLCEPDARWDSALADDVLPPACGVHVDFSNREWETCVGSLKINEAR